MSKTPREIPVLDREWDDFNEVLDHRVIATIHPEDAVSCVAVNESASAIVQSARQAKALRMAENDKAWKRGRWTRTRP